SKQARTRERILCALHRARIRVDDSNLGSVRCEQRRPSTANLSRAQNGDDRGGTHVRARVEAASQRSASATPDAREPGASHRANTVRWSGASTSLARTLV